MFVFKKIPEELDEYKGTLVVAVVGKDERPLRATNAWIDWRLFGSITQSLHRGIFHGDLGEKMMVPTYGRFSFDRVILIGAGEIFTHEAMPHTEEGRERWRSIANQIAETAESLRVKELGLSLPRFELSEQEQALLRILQSAHLPTETSLFLSRMPSHATLNLPSQMTA